MTASGGPAGEANGGAGSAAGVSAGRVPLARGVVVRRLLAVDGEGTLSRLHVRIAAELAGVSGRTVWRWLADGRRGHAEARPRHAGGPSGVHTAGGWRGGGCGAYGRGPRDRLCVWGSGLGKTVAVEQALHLLPVRVRVWRAVAGVAPGLPQLRALLCEALGLPLGALPHRAGSASQALTRALAGPGVLFLDDAQRLTPPLLDYLRQLWDAPGCAAALVLCGAGSERALARASALRSRVLTWHQVGRLEASQVPAMLSLFHPVWAQADPDDLAGRRAHGARQFPYLGEDHVACLRGPRARPRTACGPGADRACLRAPWPLPITVRAAGRARVRGPSVPTR
ncbi:AAA family ATPase [Streptomyces sp. NPDC006527]|uniref:AAA family ATPase n=1 Tax=Streptomyces sp. NPDC006527 TaxID=3364749 RepID=UPI0036C5D6CD